MDLDPFMLKSGPEANSNGANWRRDLWSFLTTTLKRTPERAFCFFARDQNHSKHQNLLLLTFRIIGGLWTQPQVFAKSKFVFWRSKTLWHHLKIVAAAIISIWIQHHCCPFWGFLNSHCCLQTFQNYLYYALILIEFNFNLTELCILEKSFENALNLILHHFLYKEKCKFGAILKINRTYKFFPFQYTRCQVN